MIFQENQGQAGAVNRGYEASSGEIVMFLDAHEAFLAEAVGRVRVAWRKGVAKVQFNLSQRIGHLWWFTALYCVDPFIRSGISVGAEIAMDQS